MDEVAHGVIENEFPARKLAADETAVYYTAYLKCSACPYVGSPYRKGEAIMSKSYVQAWAKSMGYETALTPSV
jgi:D-alanine-D-alanine ligase-like ATP-grasp enzyme